VRVLEAVATGGGLAAVARLAAQAAGGAVAIVAGPDELAACVATSIGPAVEHDARLRTEIVATFRAYLDHGANMNATAAAIYAHRHTVAARLERLGALTHLDPMRHEDRERLGLGVKAQLVLEALAEVR
jgi:DNA-binding PucR family transcriptional regulator